MEPEGLRAIPPLIGDEPIEGVPVVGKKKRDYVLSKIIRMTDVPVYSVIFNFVDSRFFNVFAAAGGNRVTVYKCREGGSVATLQAFVDGDTRVKYHTVAWSRDDAGSALLVVSGSTGIIRVIDSSQNKLLKSITGHGDSVNEVRTQLLKPCLVISASKDESVRLWNVTTGVCILVFAGAGGHRNEVLGVDFHPGNMYQFCSCGMDNTVKIWTLKDFWSSVELSMNWTDCTSKFPTKYVQYPIANAFVHSNYVDCTRWLGDFVLSKSVENEIVLWECRLNGEARNEGIIDILQTYPVPRCDLYFIKFSCDFHFSTLAIGNREGMLFVWEPQSSPPNLLARLSHRKCKTAIRQTATSYDGRTILCSCEDGSIWRWDTEQHIREDDTIPGPSSV